MVSKEDSGNNLEILLQKASQPRQTPAELRSRRHAVLKARENPGVARKNLAAVWAIYLQELERPVAAADEFARIEEYSTDIREQCAELFNNLKDRDAYSLLKYRENTLRALREEPVDSIREAMVETTQSLFEEGTLEEKDHLEFIAAVGSAGLQMESSGKLQTVIETLGMNSGNRVSKTVHEQATEELRTLADDCIGQIRVFALGRLGEIGTNNEYPEMTLEAVEGITGSLDEPYSFGEEHRESVQDVSDSFVKSLEEGPNPVKGAYMLEFLLEEGPGIDQEVMEPGLEALLDLPEDAKYSELAHIIADGSLHLATQVWIAAHSELTSLGRNTKSTLVRREILESFHEQAASTDSSFLQLLMIRGIGEVGKYIQDESLLDDTVGNLEEILKSDNYIVRSSAADAMGDIAAGSNSHEFVSRILDVLYMEYEGRTGEPLHSARTPISKIGIEAPTLVGQADALGVVRNIVSKENDGAVEVLTETSDLIAASPPALLPEVLAVIRTGTSNDHEHVRSLTVDAIPGSWIASQSEAVERHVFRLLLRIVGDEDATGVTQQSILQTLNQYLDANGENPDRLLILVLYELATVSSSVIRVFAMATLAKIDSAVCWGLLDALAEEFEDTVNLGIAWGTSDLPYDPPGPETDAEDVMKVLYLLYGGGDEDEVSQLLLAEIRHDAADQLNRDILPDADLIEIVEEILQKADLKLQRETIDLIVEHSDNFEPATRQGLVRILDIGFEADDKSVGKVAAVAIAELCCASTDPETWSHGISALSNAVHSGNDLAADSAGESLAKMASHIPPECSVGDLHQALFAVASGGSVKAATPALNGLAELGPEAVTINSEKLAGSNTESRLLEVCSGRDLSKIGLSVGIDLLSCARSQSRLR